MLFLYTHIIFVSVEFEKGEDPHLLLTGKYKLDNSTKVNLALSPNGEVVAISTGATLSFYNTLNGQCDKVIKDVYSTGKFVLNQSVCIFFLFMNDIIIPCNAM